ncbi:MAG: integrase arm-type DNA-binding domain-containing protein [Pseudohongiella sp.]|nr:integrase arm-type DNA-binding domain-containing protein [Pseudohongiella sp.]
MPKKARELTATELRRITKPGLFAVGGVAGLLFRVTDTGSQSWILRTMVGTKRRDIGLGGFPDVTLAQARDKARELKEKITQGIDPVEERKAARRSLIASQLSSITFEQAAAEFIRMKEREFRNPRNSEQWTSTLLAYAMPHIGKVPVHELQLSHIKSVLDPIWETKTETAKRIQGRLENILGWCAIHGYRSEENPARWKGYLDKVYPAPSKTRKRNHHAALELNAMPEFMGKLRTRAGAAARALEFLILTASRTNEVIGDKRIGKAGITWPEIDFEKRIWSVPAERMKSGKDHKVPLTERAIELLKAQKESSKGSLVFANPDGGIPSNNFLTSVLKRMDIDVTAHGFRSTFKDWARECTAYADEVSELALAHVNSDETRAAYARSELMDKRRLMMADWEHYCYHGRPEKASNVVSIGGAKS